MKERPILFSAPMVRAILDGRKTQTRRVLKPMSGRQAEWLTTELLNKVRRVEVGSWDCGFGVSLTHPGGGPLGFVSCPYGQPGDRLWVRETWGLCRPFDRTDWERRTLAGFTAAPEGWEVEFRADWGPNQEHCAWRPSIHMPSWASRLTLEVTGVRVERLQDISEEDAQVEGAPHQPISYRSAFRDLWDSINGERAPWKSNPFVWAISFRRAPSP